jgi:hypothetical protein
MQDFPYFLYIANKNTIPNFLYKREEVNMRITRNLGFLLLGIWLILTGLAYFIPLGGLSVILAILAIAAGVIIIIRE